MMVEPPQRMVDDDASAPELRAGLRAYETAEAAGVDYTAGLVALRASIRGGGAGPSGASGLGAWALGGGALILVIAAGTWWATRPPSADDDPTTSPSAEVPTLAAPIPRDAPRSHEEIAPPIDEASAAVPPSTVVAAEPAADRSVDPAPARRASGDTLAIEMRLVAEARRALDAHPTQTLTLLDRADREIGHGTFDEEREALRILALARVERHDRAARLGHAFLAAHPSGLFSERVRQAIEPSE